MKEKSEPRATTEVLALEEYKKSNIIVSAKYASTIFENKLMAIVLSRVPVAKKDKEGALTISISANDLRSKLKIRGNGLYENLLETSKKMTGRTIGYEDAKNKRFTIVTMINKADYSDGYFSVRFSPELNEIIENLSANYTRLNLPTMLSFKSNYSLRLYEILKSHCYKDKRTPGEDTGHYEIPLSVSELKLEMGAINTEIGSVKSILNSTGKTGTPDYDRAVASAKDQIYKEFSNFHRDCIKKAVKEINEKTELEVTYVTKKSGRGGSVHTIVFIVDVRKDKQEPMVIDLEDTVESIILSDEEKDNFIDLVKDEIKQKISTYQAREIAEHAGYDIEKVKKAYEVAKNQKKKVENIVGFMIKAIDGNWEPAVKMKTAHQIQLEEFIAAQNLEIYGPKPSDHDLQMPPDRDDDFDYNTILGMLDEKRRNKNDDE